MHCFSCNSDSSAGSAFCEHCGRPMDTDSDKYFKAGVEALAVGDAELAAEFLDNCVELDPVHLSGRYNLGIALALQDRCDEAMQHYLTLMQQSPEYPGVYTALGQAAFGSYLTYMEQAETRRLAMIQFLMMAVEQDPDDVDAYFALGNAHLALGNAEEALGYLEEARQLHPDSPAILYSLARVLKMLGRHREAAAMARDAVRLAEPGDPFLDDMHALFSELQQRVRQV